ncbi:MAG: CHAT domain-containing protein [Aureispira sp.]|nr:CHAT domain-containing protein [Aureispira sp.]
MRYLLSSFVIKFILIYSLSAQENLGQYSLVELDSICMSLQQIEAYERIYPYAKEAMKKLEGDKPKDLLSARIYFHWGLGLTHAQYEFEAAMEAYEKAIAVQEKLVPTSIDYNNTLLAIADVYYYGFEEYEEAESLYIKTKTAYSKLAKSSAMYAQNLHNLASLYESMGKYDKVEHLYLEALTLREDIFGKKHALYVHNLNCLGFYYQNVRRYLDAMSMYLEAAEIDLEVLGADAPSYAIDLSNLAGLNVEMGKNEEGERLFLQAMNIFKEAEGEESENYAFTLNYLAGIYDETGRYAEAESLYKQAIAIDRVILGEEDPSYALDLNNLAALYYTTGQYKEAEPLYKEALEIFENVLGTEHYYYAMGIGNLAYLYEAMGDEERAKSMYLEALEISKKTLGTMDPAYALDLGNLASFYRDVEEYKKAEVMYLEALAVYEKVYGKRHITYVGISNNMFLMYLEMKQYEKALICAIEVINANSGIIVSKTIDRTWSAQLAEITEYVSFEEMINTLDLLYDLLTIGDRREEQVIIVDLAMKLLKSSKDDLSDDNDKLRVLSKTADWTLRSLEVFNPETEVAKAFDLAELSKSVLLMDASKTSKAYTFGGLPDSLVQKEQLLQQKLGELKSKLLEQYSKSEKDSLRKVLNKLNFEHKAFRKSLEEQFPKYTKLKYEQTKANVEAIQEELDDETAFLEYVVGDSIVYVFYLDKKHLKLTALPIAKVELDKRIGKFHFTLSNYNAILNDSQSAYQKYTKNAYWFYEELVKPVLLEGTAIKHLVIVTDDKLGHLPFETFLMNPAPENELNYSKLSYLLQEYQISYNYSVALWKESKDHNQTQINGNILGVVANYEYAVEEDKLMHRAPMDKQIRDFLAPLPAARKEVEELAKNFEGNFVFDSLATERFFKEEAGNYGIIHVAMHGLLNNENGALSSLAFTEDGDSIDNNFLQAYEISKMDLNAALVVLSACETGYGKFETGNGIASLARAFMYAGVPSMIVSLWQVNDQATSKIMQRLYQNLATGVNKAEALRQAKLNYLKNAKGVAGHPAFWSPFVQIGDSRPIEVTKRQSFWESWGWSIAGLFLAAISVFLVRNRIYSTSEKAK